MKINTEVINVLANSRQERLEAARKHLEKAMDSEDIDEITEFFEEFSAAHSAVHNNSTPIPACPTCGCNQLLCGYSGYDNTCSTKKDED